MEPHVIGTDGLNMVEKSYTYSPDDLRIGSEGYRPQRWHAHL